MPGWFSADMEPERTFQPASYGTCVFIFFRVLLWMNADADVQLIRDAHMEGTDTSSVNISQDGLCVLTRGGDDTMKSMDPALCVMWGEGVMLFSGGG